MDRYVVVGNPIGHSKSPFIHTLFARQTMQKMEYTLLEVPIGQFNHNIDAFFNSGGRGCNVTVPFKEDAFQYATQLTERARLSGAVNTLKKLDDGGVLGDNTDGEGVVQDLLNHQISLKDAKILMLGAGGAARGALYSILQQQPSHVVVANRTFSKAETLADLFSQTGHIEAKSFEALAGESFDLIINSTASSLNKQLLPLPESIISDHCAVYDMMYCPGLTIFNQWALDLGAKKSLNGLGMLVGQAAESFMLWRGIRPGTKQVLRELRKNLEGV
ncbi:shikimate dehydrogenase [Vibrio sp. SS-MA-C1-2]|uniref:shikimate dehydrogenase n=1 Tax=Vibrio sp. SS-MA-C1-2 TaxID=2908646 RepID=UPI001F30713F|nr:shikimate dehydrogenase [Vibrio sp. SS-MA-C1-2]UJF19363.1 shikimate dehydrogenase [Vibrio sp. SS-MA-C1-2]